MKLSSRFVFGILTSGVVLLIGLIYFFGTLQQGPTVRFIPQQRQLFTIGEDNNNPISVLATTLPEFALKLTEGKFNNLWQAHAQEKDVESSIANAKGDAMLQVDEAFHTSQKELIVTPKMQNQVKPGLYTLNITVKTVTGEDVTITQDFTWGVLAINTNKGKYQVGESVTIGMAVLDEMGTTKCIAKGPKLLFNMAKVQLTITNPSGNVQAFSTDDGSIRGSTECADRSVTDKPDFLATTTAQQVGTYKVHMQATTLLGTNSIDETFSVEKNPQPFTIQRTAYPTRIYPKALYPVTVSVIANEDYSGPVVDIVPSSFGITHISESGTTSQKEDFQTIVWHVTWQKGQSYQLSYTIKFPPIAPEFYLVGPLHIGDFTEGREWQIASDSIFSLVQENHLGGASTTSLTMTFNATPTQNHLLVLICARPDNTSFTTPSGWTRRFRVQANPRLYLFDRLAPASFTSVNCASGSSGNIVGQLLEFSGNPTSSFFDKAGTTHNANTCNTGAHTETTNSITPSNPDELLVSAFVANNGSLTVSGHKTITGASSTGFCDTVGGGCSSSGGFNTATGSFANGWGEAVNNPPTAQNDTATFSGAGGTCSSDVVAYNSTITISQGSFQFFDNTNAANPLVTFNNGGTAVNTNISLNQPNQAFRVRMLLDVDSSAGNTLALQTGDFVLEYATKSGSLTCTTASYDVVSTPLSQSALSFNANPFTGTSGGNISATGSDPSDSGNGYTTVLESYYQDDSTGPNGPSPGDVTNDQNALSNNQAGLWDFSLIDNTDDSVSQTYCLRLANSDGSNLDAYRQIPQVTTIHNDVVIRGGSIIHGGTIIR